MLIEETTARAISPSDVEIVSYTGSDNLVYQAARASFGDFSEDPNPDDVRRLISKLLSLGHLVPFEHCVITYKITAPIYVLRHLNRYRTATISEQSLRYTEAAPEFCFSPGEDPEEVKQACGLAFSYYVNMLRREVPKEIARKVLPVAMFSTEYYTMNLRNLFHLFDQRCDKSAQLETRLIAASMRTELLTPFPISMSEYIKLRFPIKQQEKSK